MRRLFSVTGRTDDLTRRAVVWAVMALVCLAAAIPPAGASGSFTGRGRPRDDCEAVFPDGLFHLPIPFDHSAFDLEADDRPGRDTLMAALSHRGVAAAKAESTAANHIRNFKRASQELSGLLGFGAVVYWAIYPISGQEDEDYDWSLENLNLKTITFEAVRFDDNSMWFNSPAHPLAGALYYLIGRANGYGSGQSFLLSLAATSLWEVVVEYREVASINDMVFTPVAGFAIGEAMHKLGRFYRRGKDSTTGRLLAGIFDPVAAFNDWLYDLDRSPAEGIPLDKDGHPGDIWHRFELRTGVNFSLNDPSRPVGVSVGFESELIDVPEHDKPGRADQYVNDGVITSLNLLGTVDGDGLFEVLFAARDAFTGRYWKDLGRGGDGLRGYSLFHGLATRFEHNIHRADGFTDVLAVVNLLGPLMDFTSYCGPLRLRATAEAYGDLAAVRSYAVEKYADEQPLADTKSIVEKEWYYYALGVSAAVSFTADMSRFEVGARAATDYFDSVEGLDRFQEDVNDDFNLIDRRHGLRFWLRHYLPWDGATIELAWDGRWREGRLRNVKESSSERTLLGSVIFLF